MSIVQVRRGFGNPKSYVVRGQVIIKPRDDGFPVPSVEGGTGENSVEAPDEILGQVGVEAMFRLLLVDFIEHSRRKLRVTLMRGRIRRNVQFLDRLGHRRNRKLDHEWSGRRACDLIILIRNAPVQKSA